MSSLRIAIIGGGISGAFLFRRLCGLGLAFVDLYDQGRGVGGRSSSRYTDTGFNFDHGCQFFRADTQEMKTICNEWLESGIVSEWQGPHEGSGDFFGLPGIGPVYVSAKDGMNNIPVTIIQDAITIDKSFKLYQGVRVESIKQNEDKTKWILLGKDGEAAFHDTPENESRSQSAKSLHDHHDGYDLIVLTDISSSFGSWHRASAGVPEAFAEAVSKRAGARVPLFSTMVSFKEPLNIPFSSLTFERRSDSKVWFASRTNSKPGFQNSPESWTIVSTPEYAITKILETPMQDNLGTFIPQSPDYLLAVPAPELCSEFLKLNGLPTDREKSYLNAQRWGSALAAHRHLANDVDSPTRQTVSGVAYDSGIAPLAPTNLCRQSPSFVSSDDLGLYQIGDMVSSFTPGFESSVLSAAEASRHLIALMKKRVTKA